MRLYEEAKSRITRIPLAQSLSFTKPNCRSYKQISGMAFLDAYCNVYS